LPSILGFFFIPLEPNIFYILFNNWTIQRNKRLQKAGDLDFTLAIIEQVLREDSTCDKGSLKYLSDK